MTSDCSFEEKTNIGSAYSVWLLRPEYAISNAPSFVSQLTSTPPDPSLKNLPLIGIPASLAAG